MQANQEKVGNNYGVAMTATEFVSMFGNESGFPTDNNNLRMRFYVESRGFARVTRIFADAVIKAAA